MFGSAIVDVVLAVIFTFLAISLAASALTEAISSFLKLRQSTLRAGVQALLNDEDFTGLAKELYSHALVNPLLNKKDPATQPAYIDARQFTVALIDILQRKTPEGSSFETTLSEISDPALRQGIQALYQSADRDFTRFKTAVASWFDASMDRLAGWYKRKTQVISFCVALFCAALLNADALRVTSLVWARPTLADGLAAAAQQNDPTALAEAIKVLDAGSLIGWTDWHSTPLRVIAMVLGWTIVAGASLFGASFWFDLLQRIASIRRTGNPIGSIASGSK